MTSMMMFIFSTATEHLTWFLVLSAIVLALRIWTGVTSIGEILEMQWKMMEYCPACM